jgi:cellulose synthase operon protein C
MSYVRPSLQERMAMRPLRDVYQGSEDLWGYRAAAAMLASFELESLHPFQADPSPEAPAQLLVECDVVSSDRSQTRWSLRTPVRQTTLLRLFENGWLDAALQVNPSRDDSPTQRMFEQCIEASGAPPPLPQTLEDAAAMLEVSYWLQAVPQLWSRIPSRDSIREVIAREQLLDPFRSLVGDHFAGRVAELATLSDYVGVLEASSLSEKLVRAFENVFSIKERPPLFVVGPGGSGKSTLIAKFILDHAETAAHAQFPFAYLDFDRLALRPEEPVTLLLDAMRQLAIQYPVATKNYKAKSAEWTTLVFPQQKKQAGVAEEDVLETSLGTSMMTALSEENKPSAVGGSLVLSSEDGTEAMPVLSSTERLGFLQQFADFVQDLQPNETNQPLLLVLDTFEEVQFRSSASEDDVFDFLARLQPLIPRLRTVICGRTEIVSTQYKVRELKLENFDESAAVAFLMHQGIGDKELARTIYGQVKGSPLVLRLAADVARKEGAGPAGIAGLGSRWLAMFRSESVEVVLYKRILSHVYDQRILGLANPGLVLRYITPELLLEVLGPACKVSIHDIVDARSLVKIMRQQLATILVPYGGTEKLAHRPDMRAILLFDLEKRSKEDKGLAGQLKKIHEMAIDFYAQFEDPESRAEELFHRLSLGQDRKAIKDRWQDEAGSYLGSAILELSPSAQSFVAARTGFDIPVEVLDQASEEDWILLATRRILELERLNRPEDASKLLRDHVRSSKLIEPGQPYRDMADNVLSAFGHSYEAIRQTMPAGDDRTIRMSDLVAQVKRFAADLKLDPSSAIRFFSKGTDGDRLVGLALAQSNPEQNHVPLAIEAIENGRSPFEQYQGLVLATLFRELTDSAQIELRNALLYPKKTEFHSDRSRISLRDRLLKKWPATSGGATFSA